MTCHFTKINGANVIVCTGRARPQRCAACSKLGQLFCDGCDKPLCATCAVAPTLKLDFCPTCCRALFVEWCSTPAGRALALPVDPKARDRLVRRLGFREWAKKNPHRFEPIRTRQSVRVHPHASEVQSVKPAAEQKPENQDHQNQAANPARPVTPTGGVAPPRESANNQDDHQDDE